MQIVLFLSQKIFFCSWKFYSLVPLDLLQGFLLILNN